DNVEVGDRTFGIAHVCATDAAVLVRLPEFLVERDGAFEILQGLLFVISVGVFLAAAVERPGLELFCVGGILPFGAGVQDVLAEVDDLRKVLQRAGRLRFVEGRLEALIGWAEVRLRIGGGHGGLRAAAVAAIAGVVTAVVVARAGLILGGSIA